VDFPKAQEAGILGIIHKATQGLKWVDSCYAPRRSQAKAAGLLWGAYHFGVGGDGKGQAKNFLDTVKAEDWPADLWVLDLEANPFGPSMSLGDAEAFVQEVFNRTGKWPGLYTGIYFRQELGNPKDTLLAKCWLWLAQYTSKTTLPAAWNAWTLWQYTDGTHGPFSPREVPGIGLCDQDAFEGDEASLKAFWRMGGRAQASAPTPAS
jgi:lysozyme